MFYSQLQYVTIDGNCKNYYVYNVRRLHIIFSDGSSRFGQREPPLTDQIVNILGRYPDGGQILKVICKCNPQSAQRRVAS